LQAKIIHNFQEQKIMKTPLTILLIVTYSHAFAQPATNDDYVQNFYMACKPEKYSAYQDIQVGVQLLDTKQYDRSINRFSRALIKDKACADPYYMLAFCHQRIGKLNEAILYADSAIMKELKSPSAWIIKGTTSLMLNDFAASELCFKNSIENAPDKLDGYYGLALTYYRQQKQLEAREIINEFEARGIKSTAVRDAKKMNKLKELVGD
jgi:tetratricopeptide (TPR) repeat protein